ncbi:twin-arginine translocase TatA/TatE family subunit [Litorihabitans aurantiacus]|uniref:Sec-independent protein translocase protein TatA n=1 Tax=Litorihabitans aurantiacus TaxID=1930061 RepID=A0AA37XGC7_9MICO|nr:hypothetical protein GCM10025875_26060 [Litorihabitans aurantiacus]
MRPQLWHLLVLLAVVLLVFGAAKLPDIARNLGKSAKILKEEVKDLRTDDAPATPVAPAPQPGAAQAPASTATTSPFTPGGATPPGVASPTDAPTASPSSGTPADQGEWPPGASGQR